MKFYTVCISILLSSIFIACHNNQQEIQIEKENSGFVLKVNNEPLLIKGMNWDYFPIGHNYSYNLWGKPENFIKEVLESEMSLLQAMGVNAIRQYTGVPAKWIEYIYETYGIYTMLNHPFGRYGVEVNETWNEHTDYSNPQVKKILLKEVTELATSYKNTKGLLLFLLGNENNYGLFWKGSETENIPDDTTQVTEQAIHMYQLFNKAVLAIKAIDKVHPIAICNGDLQFIDLIAKECKDIDILGTNMYRGASFTNAFNKVKEKINKPILFTEFGSDAYNDITQQGDEEMQAYYLIHNWKEIYANTTGLQKNGNCIGGFTFQFTDGWWKYKQTENLHEHDTNASWSNEGYLIDFKKEGNNMNEEWFGICKKEPLNNKGICNSTPRLAYYALQKTHKLNPYSSELTLDSLSIYVSKILEENKYSKK